MPAHSSITVQGRVFIVGCPRSGTTLLQSLLASHPDITSFPESKFFLDLVSFPIEKSKRHAMGVVSPRLRQTCIDFLDEVGHPELVTRLPRLPLMRSYTRRFVALLDHIAALRQRPIWIEKTPDHLHHITYIEKYVPSPKIIHIVRNGEDVIASLYDLVQRYPDFWGRYLKSLDDCIARWRGDIELTRQYLDRPHHQLLRYETLIANLTAETQRLCEFIGVDYSPSMLEAYRTTSRHLVRSREDWKNGTQDKIQMPTTRKFFKVFDPAQQAYVEQAIKDVELDSLEDRQSTPPLMTTP